MRLEIKDSNNFVNLEFGAWLIPHIKRKLISETGRYKFSNWDNYLTTSNSINRLYNKAYKAVDIVLFASQHLVCNGIEGNISITFNNNIFVPGFDRLNLSTIIKTINYGTLDIKQCPIFSDVFNYFSNNIHMYLRLYYGV